MRGRLDPDKAQGMTLEQGVAAFVLWRHGKFSTYDIASLLGLKEHEVYLALHVAREAERARAGHG